MGLDFQIENVIDILSVSRLDSMICHYIFVHIKLLCYYKNEKRKIETKALIHNTSCNPQYISNVLCSIVGVD